MDITFCKTTTKGYPRQSKYFNRTWNRVLDAIEGCQLGKKRYGANRKFTLRVLEQLGGESVSQYARDFLDNHLYWGEDFESDSEEEMDGSDEE